MLVSAVTPGSLTPLPLFLAVLGNQARYIVLGEAKRAGAFLPVGKQILPCLLVSFVTVEGVADEFTGSAMFGFGNGLYLGNEVRRHQLGGSCGLRFHAPTLPSVSEIFK